MVVKVEKTGTGKNMLYLLWRTSLLAGLTMVLSKMAVPAAAAPVTNGMEATMYLAQYGYLGPSAKNVSSGMIIDKSTWSKAIAKFQKFAGLNATGELDSETADMMSFSRCGVEDTLSLSDTRSKRYALEGSRWRVRNLTFKISKYPKLLNPNAVDLELSKALNMWSEYADLNFTQKRTGRVHMDIRFETGEHDDGQPFDGPNGILAHAYYPVFGSHAHFDDTEPWSINSDKGVNLLQVAVHEFGHSLGLIHSNVQSAVMAPFYQKYIPSFTLDTDDIQGIQAEYGRKTELDVGSTAQTTPEPANGVEDSLICTDGKFDTIFNSADDSTFAFKGDYCWRLTEDGVAADYPRPIARDWPGLPGNIDAAFTYRNGKTYFFKGSKYWRFNGQRVDGEYPKEISEGFTGIPDNIDAALVWSGNGKIYFYKGTKFWRFDPTQRPPVKSTYPKPISNWKGVPDNMDAAIQYRNGYTYFFKDGAYYRFNDRTFSVDAGSPAFPRSAAYWWFGCESAPAGTVGDKTLQIMELKN